MTHYKRKYTYGSFGALLGCKMFKAQKDVNEPEKSEQSVIIQMNDGNRKFDLKIVHKFGKENCNYAEDGEDSTLRKDQAF